MTAQGWPLSIPRLLAELQSRGIILSLAEDGALRYRSARDALSDAEKARLRERRDAIIAFLLARAAGKALRGVKARPGPLTASVAQEMWWRFGGGPDEGQPVALNIGMIATFRATQAQAVTAAIRAVIARHATLRTRIVVQDGVLRLSYNRAEDFVVEHENLRHLAADADEAAGEAAANAQARATCALLNPVEGPWLTRAKIFSLPGDCVLAAISCSHIVADAGSRTIVLDELRDRLDGKDPDADAPPPVAYNDFSLAERDFLAGPQGERLIAYWRDWYAARPALRAPGGGTPLLWGPGLRIVNNFSIPKRVLDKVRALADAKRVTPFLIHLTIFSLALARWSGAADFAVRILGDKRTVQDLSGTVGLMFCADAVDIHAPPDMDFDAVMRGILTEYDASLALRIPTLHYYAPHCVRPGIEAPDFPNRIPAVFNYYSAGTAHEKAGRLAAPDTTGDMAWPPDVTRLPPARWSRRSAPVFLHLMDMGAQADASLHFYADVVTAADQQAFLDRLLDVYAETVPV